MTLPALHAFKETYPGFQAALLAREELMPLLEGYPDIDQLIPCRTDEPSSLTNALRWAGRLKREGYFAAVIFNPTKLFHAAAFLAGIRLRVGYRRKLGFLLNKTIEDTKASRPLHEADYNLELVQLLGVPRHKPFLMLPSPPRAQEEAAKLLASRGVDASARVAALHPFTSNPVKGWPLENFLALGQGLLQEGWKVVVVGVAPEGPRRAWSNRQPQAVDLIGKIPLRLLPALLKRCQVFISNDSGPVHVAAAVGTPCLVVAPPGHEKNLTRWRPLGERDKLLPGATVDGVLEAVRSLRAGHGGARSRP